MKTITVYHLSGPGYNSTVADKPTAVKNIIHILSSAAQIPVETLKSLEAWARKNSTPADGPVKFSAGSLTITVRPSEKICKVEFTGKRESSSSRL